MSVAGEVTDISSPVFPLSEEVGVAHSASLLELILSVSHYKIVHRLKHTKFSSIYCRVEHIRFRICVQER